MAQETKSKSLICPKCGQKIIGTGFPYKGKIYCSYDCVNEVVAQDEAREAQLKELYSFIKKCFQIQELPPSIIEVINQKLSATDEIDKKTVGGIQKTIEYYFNILNQSTDIKYIGWILNTYYLEAKRYYARQREIREANKLVNINVPPIVVKINPKEPNKKKNINYNMNDL